MKKYKVIVNDEVVWEEFEKHFNSYSKAYNWFDYHFYEAKNWYENEGKNIVILKNDANEKLLVVNDKNIRFKLVPC